MRQPGSNKIPAVGAGRIAVLAGSGTLPVVLARNIENAGMHPFVVMIRGEADPSLNTFDHIEISLGQITKLPSLLKNNGITHVVPGGGISRRPSLLDLRPSMVLFRFLFRAIGALSRGDDKLLRTLIGIFENEGLTVIGAHEVVPEILAGTGLLTRTGPGKADLGDIDAARSALQLTGSLDLGQAAVSIGGRIVALEGPEGTDAMLRRVAELRKVGRLPANPGGVLVKCAKPGQELRVDLPSIGPDTVANAAAARLRGIAIEGGKSIVLERERTIAAAEKAGLFITGIEAGPE